MNPELQVQVSKPLMFTQVTLLLATKINNIKYTCGTFYKGQVEDRSFVLLPRCYHCRELGYVGLQLVPCSEVLFMAGYPFSCDLQVVKETIGLSTVPATLLASTW